MTTKTVRSLTILAVLLTLGSFLAAQEAPEGLATGLREYQAGRFEEALGEFQRAAANPDPGEYRGYADFWVARSLMAVGRYEDAANAFDIFLVEFGSHPYREEAAYQRARLFYLTDQHEAAVQEFAAFQDDYPESDFSANALYWTGESLFALGNLSEARRFFEEVTEKYPTSFRVEAARYRQDVIDLEQREDELLTLLQWSHEEYLLALDEFRQKEIAYQEALQSYRERLSTLAGEDFREEIQLLNARIGELEDTLSERDAQINDLLAQLRQAEANANAAMALAQSMRQAQPAQTEAPVSDDAGDDTARDSAGESSDAGTASGASADVQSELLSLKAAALELQQRLLQQGSEQ